MSMTDSIDYTKALKKIKGTLVLERRELSVKSPEKVGEIVGIQQSIDSLDRAIEDEITMSKSGFNWAGV